MVTPSVLTRPARMTSGPGPGRLAPAIRAIGIRDVAIGIGMMVARRPETIRTIGAARVAADLGDAVLFGTALPPGARGKIGGFAAGWGLLSAIVTAAAARR